MTESVMTRMSVAVTAHGDRGVAVTVTAAAGPPCRCGVALTRSGRC